jgi:hypothetical protein
MAAAAAVWGGTVDVPDYEDIVELTNGKTLTCTVLMRGEKLVIVLYDEKEMELEPSEIKSIKKLKATEDRTSYITGPVDGIEKIIRKGSDRGAAATDTGPKTGTAKKKKPAQQKPAAKPANRGKPKQKTPAKAAPKKKAQPKQNPRGITIPKGMQDRLKNLLKDPNARKMLNQLKASGKLDQYLKQINDKELLKLLNNPK